MGDPGFHRRWRSWLLCLLLLCPSLAAAAELVVRELRDDPPAAEVLAGLHDARLLPPEPQPMLRQPGREAQWWRIEARQPVPADDARTRSETRSVLICRQATMTESSLAVDRYALLQQ